MRATPAPVAPAQVKALRGFNRFYTQRIGVLAPYLGSELTLTAMRVLYELAHRDQPTASELGRDLALDAGYLSRILRGFEQRGWLARAPSPADARQSLLKLTAAGHEAFAPLQQKSRDEASALLSPLPLPQREQLMGALATVQRLLEPAAPRGRPRTVVLRDPQPGDMGWVVMQHGEVYWREYGFNAEFESLVAGIAAQYIDKFDPAWDKGWIAELDGERVGAAFVVRRSATVAQLRMLVLTPGARGLGLGGRLVDECIAFARARGYRKLMLWTQSMLTAARAIYKGRGFAITRTQPQQAFGQEMVSEIWELKL